MAQKIFKSQTENLYIIKTNPGIFDKTKRNIYKLQNKPHMKASVKMLVGITKYC